jgi:hypothetical protein
VTDKKARKNKTHSADVEIEPGAEKRLSNILKKALNTPPPRKPTKATKADAGRKTK